jgi:hypothetical protein
VPLNRVKLAFHDSSSLDCIKDGVAPPLTSEKEFPARQQSEFDKMRQYTMPLLLLHEGILHVRLTPEGGPSREFNLPYTLPYSDAKIASTWTPVVSSQQDSSRGVLTGYTTKMTIEEMLQEPRHTVERKRSFTVSHESGLSLEITLQMMYHARTGEPLSYFMNRLFALTQVAILAPKEIWGGGGSCAPPLPP